MRLNLNDIRRKYKDIIRPTSKTNGLRIDWTNNIPILYETSIVKVKGDATVKFTEILKLTNAEGIQLLVEYLVEVKYQLTKRE